MWLLVLLTLLQALTVLSQNTSVLGADLYLQLTGLTIPTFLPTTTVVKSSFGRPGTPYSTSTCSPCQQATAAVLMLVHQGVAHAAVWKQWEQLHNGSLVIWVHNKASSKLGPGVSGRSFIKRRLLTTSLDAGWGDLLAVSAIIQSFREILGRCSNVRHIAVVSGKDIPLQMMREHTLPAQGRSYI
jgi:hypothetical protein